VLVRFGGVGLCHSDVYIMDAPPDRFPFMKPPFTLGHENAGWVEALGDDVEGFAPGDAVLADSHFICGRCEYCMRGFDNYCVHGLGRGQGAGEDGGLAPYIVVPANRLVRLRTLDPRVSGPLADAGRTSYHVVKRALPKLIPGSTAIVIGAGGLGGYAVQWLSRLSASRIIAVDVAPHRLALVQEFGAHEAVRSDSNVVSTLLALTNGRKAEAVFDFVGTDQTIATALSVSRTMGTFALVGAAGGTASIAWGSVPLECEVFIPLGGSHSELHEVVALAEQGSVRSEVETFTFDQVKVAYERVRTGDTRGRVVVCPDL
jgi:propanol-preferring alcohol dehydrogenase